MFLLTFLRNLSYWLTNASGVVIREGRSLTTSATGSVRRGLAIVVGI